MKDGLEQGRPAGTEFARSAESPGWSAEFETKMNTRRRRHGESKALVYDALTEDIIRRACSTGSNCVDVGAAVGVILRQIVAAAPDGRHYAFEPVPTWADDLRRAFPCVHVIEAAVSDTPGNAKFSLVTTSPFYSGLRPQPYPFADPAIEEITVRTVTLNEAIPPDLAVSFLKIDVEGAEVLVLRGADRLLRRDHPVIVFEHGGSSHTRGYGTTTQDLWSILVDELGYSVSGMADWLAGKPPLTNRQFRQALAHGEFQFVGAATGANP